MFLDIGNKMRGFPPAVVEVNGEDDNDIHIKKVDKPANLLDPKKNLNNSNRQKND